MSKKISTSEVRKHKTQRSAWIIIENSVYDVTKYLNEHPGGAEPILEFAGKDATMAFNDVGHSDDARKIMKKYKIGVLPPEETVSYPCSCLRIPDTGGNKKDRTWRSFDSKAQRRRRPGPTALCDDGGSNLKWILLALAGAVVLGFVLKKYATQ